jgi:transposase
MLSFARNTRVFLALGATDLRKSFDGLAGVTRAVIQQDPLAGHVFVFCNRPRTRLRILYFDGSGFWVLAKRLERGTFTWPSQASGGAVEIGADELVLLLSGIDLAATVKRRWYGRAPERRIRQRRAS